MNNTGQDCRAQGDWEKESAIQTLRAAMEEIRRTADAVMDASRDGAHNDLAAAEVALASISKIARRFSGE